MHLEAGRRWNRCDRSPPLGRVVKALKVREAPHYPARGLDGGPQLCTPARPHQLPAAEFLSHCPSPVLRAELGSPASLTPAASPQRGGWPVPPPLAFPPSSSLRSLLTLAEQSRSGLRPRFSSSFHVCALARLSHLLRWSPSPSPPTPQAQSWSLHSWSTGPTMCPAGPRCWGMGQVMLVGGGLMCWAAALPSVPSPCSLSLPAGEGLDPVGSGKGLVCGGSGPLPTSTQKCPGSFSRWERLHCMAWTAAPGAPHSGGPGQALSSCLAVSS